VIQGAFQLDTMMLNDKTSTLCLIEKEIAVLRITLTPEQKSQLQHEGSLEICDPIGNRIATLQWEDTLEFVEDVKRQIAASRDKPKVPGNKVLDHLAALENEWTRTGGFDSRYAVEFVDGLRAEDHE